MKNLIMSNYLFRFSIFTFHLVNEKLGTKPYLLIDEEFTFHLVNEKFQGKKIQRTKKYIFTFHLVNEK